MSITVRAGRTSLSFERPARYRSLATLLALTVAGSVLASVWLRPSRLERVAMATELGEQGSVERELALAARAGVDPGETRALVAVALSLGRPDTAAMILERALVRQPDSLNAWRLLLEVQRQRHVPRVVAAVDEQIYARSGEIEALRDAADIYASQRMGPERADALRRIDAAGRASAEDMAELAHRVADANEALGLVMGWLERSPAHDLPAPLVGLAAGLSVGRAGDAAIAARLGALIGRAGQDGPLHGLVQVYAERGRPELSLIAAHEMGPALLAAPGTAVLVAQLEALQGDYAAAAARLEALGRAGRLDAAGSAMLIDLSLQGGRSEQAVALLLANPDAPLGDGLGHRLVEALARDRPADLARLSLARLPLDRIAAVSAASGAVVALAQQDRARAAGLVQAALTQMTAAQAAATQAAANDAAATQAAGGVDGELDDFGPAFAGVVRALGVERLAVERLASAMRSGRLGNAGFSLLLDLADGSPADLPGLLPALLSQRDVRPRAGFAWAALAARHGQGAAVASWVQGRGARLPSQGLIDLLLLAVERGDVGLGRVAAAALAGRADLPPGWSAGEIALTLHARDGLTPERLQEGLALIGAAAATDAARDRVAALLVGARDFVRVARGVRGSDPALAWLQQSVDADAPAEIVAARIGLLAGIAPERALATLAAHTKAEGTGPERTGPAQTGTDPHRYASMYAAALLRCRRDAVPVLTAALHGANVRQQDALLQDVLARIAPGEALPVLRVGAATQREDWVAAFEDGLRRANRIDELRAVLRLRATRPGVAVALRQALAARLLELGDRAGAIAILTTMAAGRAPNDPAVEQLMYLWGPRANPDAVAWTRAQAMEATPERLAKWLEHLSYLGDPAAVMAVLQGRPGVLGTASAVRIYGAALAASHTSAKPDLRSAIAATTGVETLTALAQLAQDTGQPAPAWQAAQAAVAANPADGTALRQAAQAAAAMRRSADAAMYYERLLAQGQQPVEVSVDAGDALLSARRTEPGRAVLRDALARLPSEPRTLAEARLRARALLLLRRDREAVALLDDWLGRFPTHAGLRADRLQAQLDGETIARP